MEDWITGCFYWAPPGTHHQPLYFEEVNLERYGYGHGHFTQPFVSAAHFFGRVPALPYLLTADHPHKCIYTYGHYRLGSPAPYRHHWPPLSAKAALVQAGVTTGMFYLIP